MHTNRPHYLPRNLNIKSILLATIAAFLVSACGIKGSLYQTPEQTPAEQSTEKIHEQSSEKDTQPANKLDHSDEDQAINKSMAPQQEPLETLDESQKTQLDQQNTEQATKPRVKPSANQPIAQVKEQK